MFWVPGSPLVLCQDKRERINISSYCLICLAEVSGAGAEDGAAAVEGSETEDEPASEAPSSEVDERDSLVGDLSSSGDEEQGDTDVEGTSASQDEEGSGTGAALQMNACQLTEPHSFVLCAKLCKWTHNWSNLA